MAVKLKELLTGKKATKWIVAAGIIGVAFILLSEFMPVKKEAPVKQTSTQEYAVMLEQRLTQMVGSIGGVGKAQVLVTLENGYEYVYASEERINTDKTEDTGDSANRTQQRDDTEKRLVVIGGANGEEALVRTEILPTVKGVVVVCEGGDQAIVQERITQAVTTALGITAKRVCVVKRS